MNDLCKTTGATESESNLENCSSPPLSGRFVTVQRTKYEENPSDVALQALAIAEVDVIFFI